MAGGKRGGTKTSGIHVALLRGVNVGGKNKLPMKDLAAIFEDLGCNEVRTYIQSGNVVFRATPTLVSRVAGLVEEAIGDGFGLRVPVLMRSAADIRRIARANPFLRSGGNSDTLHVAFLANRPSKARVSALDPDRSPGDRFVVRGSEIYVHCPNGVARTKLSNAYFDSKLATTSTVRNWKTVLKLVELSSEG